MAPRQRSRAREELHVEELDEPAPPPRETRPAGRRRPSSGALPGTLEAKLFQGVGALGMAAGLGLWVGAGFHEGIAGTAAALTQVGLHPGTLAVGSFLLLAFGRVRKAQVEAAQRATQGPDDGLLEQVATEQVRAHQALERLASAQSELSAGQQSLAAELQQLAAVLEQAQQDQGGDTQAQEAIFRLAASLDQLGARVEQRMQGQYDAFHADLRQVSNEIVQAQSELRMLLGGLPAHLFAAPQAEPLPGEPLQAESQFESVPLDAGAEDPWSVEAAQGMAPPVETPAELEHTGYSLGVLDTIPDEVMGAATPQAPFASAPRGPEESAPQAALPAAPPHVSGIIPEEHKTPAERAAELDTSTKLTQLKDLLADDRLRAALEEMRRNG